MRERQPRVTVGVPVYNGELYLRRALESLIAQDYPNLEIVISDNASTDLTRSIAQEFERRDSRVRLQTNDRNIGAVANFRKLVVQADTPYFMWAAADDFWLPTFVSRLAQELDEHGDAGVAFCAVDLVDDQGVHLGQIRFLGEHNPNRLSYWQMAHGLVTPRKYNLWVYGLFRTPLLQGAMDRCPDIPASDRWIVLLVALAARIRYVDEVLHQRTVRPRTRVPTMAQDVRNGVITVLVLTRMILTAQFIPWSRRAWAPLISGHYALLMVKWFALTVAHRLHRRLGSPLRRSKRP